VSCAIWTLRSPSIRLRRWRTCCARACSATAELGAAGDVCALAPGCRGVLACSASWRTVGQRSREIACARRSVALGRRHRRSSCGRVS
jgi:hypothetical protein